MRIKRLHSSEWAEALPVRGTEPFHTAAALDTIDQHVSGTVHLLGGFKGDEPVGLFPIHERQKLGARLLTSPPLSLGIGRLGPLVMSNSPKQRKQERTNRRFIRAALDELDAANPRTLLRLACSPEYSDPRPFQWNGFQVEPAFTYRLSLDDTDADTVLKNFTRDLRREIGKEDEVPFDIERGGINDVRRIYDSVKARHRDQNHRYPLPWEFVRDLVDTLDEQVRVYVARTDGEFVAGTIVLYSAETAYFWKGGTKTDHTVSPNSLLHWRIIKDVLEDPELSDIEAYDLYTANNERLAEYKSKLGGSPQPYFVVESGGPAMTAAKGIYRMAAFGKNPLGESGQL